MMIQTCKKCGSSAVGRYNGCSDKMQFRCTCGYRWSALPLDRADDANIEAMKRTYAWFGGQVDTDVVRKIVELKQRARLP